MVPKLTEAQLYELLEDVAKTILEDMQSDDTKVRLPARSSAIKLLRNNRVKVDPMLSEDVMELADDVANSEEWSNSKNVPFMEN